MADLITCGRCGMIHERGKCQAKRKPPKYSKTEEDRIRGRQTWRRKSAQIRSDAFHLCEVCRDKGKLNSRLIEVHHIEKLRDFPELALEDENLIALCSVHHKEADAGELSKDYLKRLALERIERVNNDGR